MSRMNWENLRSGAKDRELWKAVAKRGLHYYVSRDKNTECYSVEVDQYADGDWTMLLEHIDAFLSLADAQQFCETHYAVAT